MKACCYILLIILFTSCSKEETETSIVGRWTLVEVFAGGTPGSLVSNYAPHSKLSVQFKPNGELIIDRYDSLQFSSHIASFNYYQKKSETELLLSNTQTGETIELYCEVNNQLTIGYPWALCGYDEKFVRY